MRTPGLQAKDALLRCPTCGHGRQREWIRDHCGMEHHEQDRRLMSWLVPRMTPEQSEQRRLAKRALSKAIQDRRGLVTFFGDFGSGKTLALQVVLNELRELYTADGFYAPMATILSHLRSLYGAGRDDSSFWQRLLDVPALAVDEVTRFSATDWARERLFVLADTRYRRRHSHLTLFATNDDPRRSRAPSDDLGYLYSRMREGVLVELRGDVRQAAIDG